MADVSGCLLCVFVWVDGGGGAGPRLGVFKSVEGALTLIKER